VPVENVEELHSKDRMNSLTAQWDLLRKIEIFIKRRKFTHAKRSRSSAECEVWSNGECGGVQSDTLSINELTVKTIRVLERNNISSATT
jgi:hypothetical protein